MKLGKTGILMVCLALCLCLLAAPALATTVDFTTGFTPTPNGANYGSSLTFADLTLTAKSILPNTTTDPLTTALYPGTVFWGNLGNMDGPAGPYYGLGVQGSDAALGSYDSGGKNGGSFGISGAGPQMYEALVFTFTGSPIDATSVVVTLNGLNSSGKNADSIALWLSFSGTQFAVPWGDLNDAGNGISGDGIATLAFNAADLLALTSGQTFGSFALEADTGHFGVQGIDYAPFIPVPVTPSAFLLGTSLLGLLGLGWKRKKAS
jgi:hypothetical protein